METSIAADLETCLDRLGDLHIGVIGDVALDCYWTLNPGAALPSVETGLPTRPVVSQRYAAGGAGNVAIDLVALGVGRVSVFGVIGEDPWGAELARRLLAAGVETAGLLFQVRDWATVAYAKPHIDGIEQSRIDFGDFNRLHDSTADRLTGMLADALPHLDAVVINAQARVGVHSARLRERLGALVEAHPGRVFTVDSREPAAMYPGTILKINDIEAARVCGFPPPDGSPASRERTRRAAGLLHARQGRPVFVTCGVEGMLVCDRAGVIVCPAVALEGELDTTGAGDAALAAITATLATGLPPATAACAGNLAAAVCAGKLQQTGTASCDEILALIRRDRTLRMV